MDSHNKQVSLAFLLIDEIFTFMYQFQTAQQTLEPVRRVDSNQTLLIIIHCLSTIRFRDLIYVVLMCN